jgi:release factor glutamine methyltransferase
MPAVDSPQTVSDALHTATTLLTRASSSPRLDAELLLEYVTGRTRTDFRAAPERELPVKAGWAFQQLVMRRLKGEPIAYIRGEQEFWSLTFEVSPSVLIPRPETELLVERVLALCSAQSTASIADLGTGSGAVALAIASERREAHVIATDLSQEALDVARRNAARLQLSNVEFRRGNWFEPLRSEYFDVIVSNPPYIAETDPDLASEVRRHEPALALFSGPTGLDAIATLVRGASTRLQHDGWLVLEHGWKQAGAVRDLLVRQGYTHVRSHPDLAGHERVTEACWRQAGARQIDA